MNQNEKAEDQDPRQDHSFDHIDIMRISMKQIDAGEGLSVEQCFDPIRAKLIAMKKLAQLNERKR